MFRPRARGRSRIATSSSHLPDAPSLDDWLTAVVSTPGLTAFSDLGEARRVLLDDSLAGAPLLAGFGGPVVDVGSGGGAPGIPLAYALPDREFVLLEAERRKCGFLAARAPANATVVWGRAEEQETDWAGVAVAKALAAPPTAAEWCLPLVREGGGVVLWVGPTADAAHVGRVAARIAGEVRPSPPGFIVIDKVGPTPPGFPRRTGVARKRPLA
ncbi:MAG: 16S rRNA (guanine(527)-N(7))-methyltransferase RsmG [Gaiellaceae bacterium]